MQLFEDFTAAHAEVGLKKRWEINIAAIQTTIDHKAPEIITSSDFFNWMHTMIALGAMKLQAGAEVPEVRSMAAMVDGKVGMESLKIRRTNVISVVPTATP